MSQEVSKSVYHIIQEYHLKPVSVPVEENECMTKEPCSQICENILGGYTCSCQQGYQLTKDNTTCTGKHCVIYSKCGLIP